ncbi:MAG: inosine/xanthosine triphosphatase, partial [Bacteroidota bacterium]
MGNITKVVVGSKDESKINATKQAFTRIFSGYEIEVNGLAVNSHVSEQPNGRLEIALGARNRCLEAKKIYADANYYVGIEGGVTDCFGNKVSEESGGYTTSAFFIMDKEGRFSRNFGDMLMIPNPVKEKIIEGYKLGKALRDFLDVPVNNGLGAAILLTDGKVD